MKVIVIKMKEDMVYELIRSHRKTMAIQIKNGKVVVRAPLYMSQKQIEEHLQKKSNWIKKHLWEMKYVEKALKYQDGDVISIYGQPYILSFYELSTAGKDDICLIDNKLCITANKITQELIREMLSMWCKKQGKYYFMQSIGKYAPKMHVEFHNVFVKDQKSRWGSCSSKKNLNFNWRLLLMPPEILDYVVVHELAHLKVMNHSSDFWRVVKEQLIDYEKYRQWLQEHGNEYMVI